MKKLVFVIIILLSTWLPAGSQGYIETIGSCPLPDEGWHLEVSGNYAFMACRLAGLQVADVTDPENPAIVAYYLTPDAALDLCLVADLAFIADFSSLQIVNISDPLFPDSLASYQSDNVLSVHVSGDYAYIGCGYNSPVFKIIDISDPTSPEFVSGLTFLGGVGQLYYSDGYLYVLSNETEPYSNYLRAIGVSDPLNPFVAGSVQIPGDVEIPGDIMVDGDFAYIADRSSGLQIVDISDPENMEVIGSYDTPGDATGIFLNEHFAIIADYFSGIQIIGVVDPADPSLVDEGFTAHPAISACGWYWDLIYVTTTDSLVIFQYRGDDIETDPINPREFSVLQNYPNPFNATTALRFTLPVRSDIRIEICDILGQKVDVLFEGNKGAGNHGVNWNADNFPSGVYFARLEAGGGSETIKMVLLK